jgi:GNAT superfamily N-acetyltransferase
VATFVAVEKGAFVGVVDGYLAGDRGTAEIGGMWVNPERRRAGIGRELLGAICDWARARGAVRAGLWVRRSNSPARHLYESDGFDSVEASGGIVGLRLEKAL